MYSSAHHNNLFSLLKKLQPGPNTKASTDFEHFKLRLAANYSSLHELFGELYGGAHESESWIGKLIEGLYAHYQSRDKKLKALDLERERNPQWLLNERWMGMMLYVDHFSGDIKGLANHLPYLEELGVNWVHLMPLLKSPPGENDGGYAVSDYREVDPALGTMEDLRRLGAEFRKRGMLLAIDFVMNHTSDEHEWAVKAKSGDKEYQDYFFMFEDRTVPDQFEQTMPEVFPESAPGNFTFDPQCRQWVMTQFHNYQWDLNYYNPRVLLEMVDAAMFLLNQGVDILRLDAVPFIWKKLGTQCRNEYEAHVILRIFKACVEIVAPGVAFIAEAIVRPHEIMGYFGEGQYQAKECDIAYNATFMALCWEALATGETTVMNRVTSQMPRKPFGTTWINYLRSHDDIGLGFDDEDLYALGIDAPSHRRFIMDFYSGTFPGSTATGAPFAYNPKTGDARISGTLAALSGLEKAVELENEDLIAPAISRILMLQSLVLAYGGLPMIYSGGEIGLPNDKQFASRPEQAHDNRWMHRPRMDWEKAENRKAEGSVEQRIFRGLQHLISVRKTTPQFADHNNFSLVATENKHIFSFIRSAGEGNVLVMANFFNGTQFVKQDIIRRAGMDPGKVVDLITGVQPRYYHDLVEFDPYQSYWLGTV